MKTIEMNVQRCGGKGWHDDGTKTFKRVSRWITVKQNYNPRKNNSLWDFVMDGYGYKTTDNNFDPEKNGGIYLDYFTFKGRNYAIEQFFALGNPFYMPVTYSYDENGKKIFLSGVDMYGDLYKPIYIEMSECGESVRVYEEI